MRMIGVQKELTETKRKSWTFDEKHTNGKMIMADDQQFNHSIWTVVLHSSTTVISSYSPRGKVSLLLENRGAGDMIKAFNLTAHN